MTNEIIDSKFNLLGGQSPYIKALYGILPCRPTSCKIGALDFLHDARFTNAIERIVQQWRGERKAGFGIWSTKRIPGNHPAEPIML